MSALLEDLARLSGFAGDAPAALRELHRHLSATWKHVSLALVLVDGCPPGAGRLAGLIGPDGTELLPAHDPYGRQAQLPRFDDTVAARCLFPALPRILDLTPAERGLPFAQALLAPASVLALPMVNQGRFVHWLVLGSTLRRRFQGLDIDAALREATLAYSLLAHSLTVRTITANAAQEHHAIESLADVQRALQPEGQPLRGLEFAVHWQPAETAAGDYYDLMPLQHGVGGVELERDTWGLMLADVSGHGAAAAMEAVQFDAILRTYRGHEPPGGPAGALAYANRHFFSRRLRRHFLTVFAAIYHPHGDRLDYVCAGHPPAVLRSQGQLRLLGAGDDSGIPLGILREHRWDNAVTGFAPGDILVAYTDGVVEARDRRRRMYGVERLQRVVANAEPEPAAMLAAIRADLFEHQDRAVGSDDQTILVLLHT
ncbi:MAG: PP2C family protein-serine/threonine phosphatase [Gammaproteobacteria bacterium]